MLGRPPVGPRPDRVGQRPDRLLHALTAAQVGQPARHRRVLERDGRDVAAVPVLQDLAGHRVHPTRAGRDADQQHRAAKGPGPLQLGDRQPGPGGGGGGRPETDVDPDRRAGRGPGDRADPRRVRHLAPEPLALRPGDRALRRPRGVREARLVSGARTVRPGAGHRRGGQQHQGRNQRRQQGDEPGPARPEPDRPQPPPGPGRHAPPGPHHRRRRDRRQRDRQQVGAPRRRARPGPGGQPHLPGMSGDGAHRHQGPGAQAPSDPEHPVGRRLSVGPTAPPSAQARAERDHQVPLQRGAGTDQDLHRERVREQGRLHGQGQQRRGDERAGGAHAGLPAATGAPGRRGAIGSRRGRRPDPRPSRPAAAIPATAGPASRAGGSATGVP
jgi:hypothetical protein